MSDLSQEYNSLEHFTVSDKAEFPQNKIES